jgi:hypothetical protein
MFLVLRDKQKLLIMVKYNFVVLFKERFKSKSLRLDRQGLPIIGNLDRGG